jgi:hypothetical protein
MSEPGPRESTIVDCPECGQPIPAPADEPIHQCSHCGAQFFRPETTTEEEATEGPSQESPEPRHEKELDGLRIRQISALRRATFRTRSYYFIAAAACLVTAIQLAIMIYHRAAETRLRMPPSAAVIFAGYILFLLASLCGVFYFERKIVELTHELRKSLIETPLDVPDFSPLSDGSHHVKNLKDLVE